MEGRDTMKTEKEFLRKKLKKVIIDQNKAMLATWDSGSSIWSIEMGGLGPNYELGIQRTMVEIVRKYLTKPLPTKEQFENWADSVFSQKEHNTHSGASAGSAKWLAYKFLEYGHENFIDVCRKHDESRMIQVSKK